MQQKRKTISYRFDSLSDAVECYHKCVSRLESWETKYPNYDYDICIITEGIKRMPSVEIKITKREQ